MESKGNFGSIHCTTDIPLIPRETCLASSWRLLDILIWQIRHTPYTLKFPLSSNDTSTIHVKSRKHVRNDRIREVLRWFGHIQRPFAAGEGNRSLVSLHRLQLLFFKKTTNKKIYFSYSYAEKQARVKTTMTTSNEHARRWTTTTDEEYRTKTSMMTTTRNSDEHARRWKLT